jgi:hypothetical protein
MPWSEREKARNRLSERLSRIVRFLVLVLLKVFENVTVSAARGEAGLASQIVNAAEETFIPSNSPPTASSDKYSGSQRRHATGNALANDSDPRGLALAEVARRSAEPSRSSMSIVQPIRTNVPSAYKFSVRIRLISGS